MTVPNDRPVAVLMRHSARFPILDPDDPYQAELTEEGIQMAEELGGLLGTRFQPGRLLSSPVNRCIATCLAIARGAGWPEQVKTDERISHPFIGPVYFQMESGKMSGSLLFQVRAVLNLMLEAPTEQPALPHLDIMVTHDTIVGTVAGYMLRTPVLGRDWPEFLEGVFAWRSKSGIILRWRGQEVLFSEDFLRIE